MNKAYITSVDLTTKQKLLRLFLACLKTEYYKSRYDLVEVFLPQICDTGLLKTLNPGILRELIDVVMRELDEGGEREKLEGIQDTIFCTALAREDEILLEAETLGDLLACCRFPANPARFEHVSLEFLRRLVQTIFRIWDGQRRVYIGYYPGKLVQQLIAREGHEQETLTKFFSLAPAEWLATYWPEIDAWFDLRAMALDPTGVYLHLLHKLEEAKEVAEKIGCTPFFVKRFLPIVAAARDIPGQFFWEGRQVGKAMRYGFRVTKE